MLRKNSPTIQRKISILFGYFSKFFTPCLHLFSPQQKIPLYNTEKKLSFVDVFSEKFTNYFHAKEKFSPCRQGLSISFIFVFLVYPTVRECRFTRAFSILKFFRIFIIAHCQPKMCKYCIFIEILYAKSDGAFKLKLYFY